MRYVYMGISLFDVGKLLIAQEENSNSALKQSLDNLNKTISSQQKITAPSKTSVTEGKTKYFTDNKENYITSGTLFSTDKNITFKLFKVVTAEWDNLSIYVDNQLFLSGDFAYYNEIGLAYQNANGNYVFNLMNETYEDGVKITIDSGLTINSFNIIGKIVS